MTRPPVTIDARTTPPKAWKDAARARSGEVCAYPECTEASGLEYDHILALKLGGRHRADNIQALCHAHHLQKTKLDVKLIAKAKAQGGETGQYARRQKRGASSIQSAGFQKNLTKGVDGKVRPRPQTPGADHSQGAGS